jgi:hypothetical protein
MLDSLEWLVDEYCSRRCVVQDDDDGNDPMELLEDMAVQRRLPLSLLGNLCIFGDVEHKNHASTYL